MRKVLSLVLALAFALSAVPAMAQTEFEFVSEGVTFFHYAFMVYSGKYEFGDNTPFWPLTGHGYGAENAAFRTKNGLFDAVFIPDQTGVAVKEIQLLGYSSKMVGSQENWDLACMHTLGLIFPYAPELASLPDGEGALMKAIIEVCAYASLPSYQQYSAEPVVMGDICTITPFFQGKTFGVKIVFNKPMTDPFLMERMWLTDAAFEE